MQGDRERYIASGMDDYISKPIRIEELVRALADSQPINHQTPSLSPQPFEVATDTVVGSNPMIEGLPSMPAIIVPDLIKQSTSVNPAVLQEFQELMGEDGLSIVVNLVDLYCSDSPTLIKQMKQFLAGTDFDGLRRSAHTLKGNSNQIGAGNLAELCYTLEKKAKNSSNDGAIELIEQIEVELVRVSTHLKTVYHLPR